MKLMNPQFELNRPPRNSPALLPGAKITESRLLLFQEIASWINGRRSDKHGEFAHEIGAENVITAFEHRKYDWYTSVDAHKPGRSEKRPISIPPNSILSIQRELLAALPLDFAHDAAWAYTPHKSAVECARQHIGMSWGVKLDITGFFHQIRTTNVKQLLESWGHSELTATAYAEIFTRLPLVSGEFGHLNGNGILPQGSPTSGALSNLVCRYLDSRIAELAISKEMTYTRYSDDIFITSKDESFTKLHALRLVRQVRKIVNEFGMTINKNKTRVYGPNSSFQYLGLLISKDRVRLPRHYRDQLDKTDYMIGRIGLRQVELEYTNNNPAISADRKKTAGQAGFFITRYVGQLTYAHQIEPDLSKKHAKSLSMHILNDHNTWARYYDDYTRSFVTASLKVLLR